MYYSNKNYMKKLFRFSEEFEGVEMNFKDENLEANFIVSNRSNDYQKSKIFCLLSSSAYISFSLISLIGNKFQFNRATLIYVLGLIIDYIMYLLSNLVHKNLKIHQGIRITRFIIFYVIFSIQVLFPLANVNLTDCNHFRFVYAFCWYMNLIYLYYLDFKLVMLLLVPIFNILILIFLPFYYDYPKDYFYTEIYRNIFYYFVTFLIKKQEFGNRKEKFLEFYKNEHYMEYIKQLINVLNTMVISLNRQEVLFMNNFAIDYFKNSFTFSEKSEEDEVDIHFTNEKRDKLDIKGILNLFFKSLILDTSFYNNLILLNEGNSLDEIIQLFFRGNNLNSKHFIRIGFFRTLDKSKFFEIFVRQLKFKEEVIEILINDITEVKIAEKSNIETKYKQKILAKIAHEFKTPLVTITSLINKMIYHQIQVENKVCLNHINNLSNYTISLISDIIQYVSDSIDLRLNKSEIFLREVLEFSFNVLQTLIECNENKANKIETKIEIDNNIDNLTVYTDENRLKQILLNFVSNAVKFTKSGFIKIKAKYNFESKSIEISVNDSGLGIKCTDHNLIFKENVQLNIEKEYTSKGSGLGLSITKTLATSLNHEIWFDSIIGEGSQFYLKMKCSDIFQVGEFNDFNFLKENNIDCLDNNESLNLSKINFSKDLLNNNDITEKNKFLLNNEVINFSFKTNNKYSFETNHFGFSLGNFNSDHDNYFKILVVDDNKFVRENTVYLLKNALNQLKLDNFLIVEGSDGIDILNFVRLDNHFKIRYIFTDESMQFLDGSEAVKLIRKFEENDKIKSYNIISLTAFDDPQTRNKILNCGLNSIMSKPATKTEIMKILIKHQN